MSKPDLDDTTQFDDLYWLGYGAGRESGLRDNLRLHPDSDGEAIRALLEAKGRWWMVTKDHRDKVRITWNGGEWIGEADTLAHAVANALCAIDEGRK